MINKVFVFALLAVSLVQVYCATVPPKAPKANAVIPGVDAIIPQNSTKAASLAQQAVYELNKKLDSFKNYYQFLISILDDVSVINVPALRTSQYSLQLLVGYTEGCSVPANGAIPLCQRRHVTRYYPLDATLIFVDEKLKKAIFKSGKIPIIPFLSGELAKKL